MNSSIRSYYCDTYANHFRSDIVGGVSFAHQYQDVGEYNGVLQTLHGGPQTVHHDPGVSPELLLVQHHLPVSLHPRQTLEQILQVFILLKQPEITTEC